MKPQTFFRSALFIPYLLWVLCVLIALPFTKFSEDIPQIWNVISVPVMVYLIGIILWFFPYTVLAIGLWVWSGNKTVSALKKTGMISPFLLAFLMVVETGLLFFFADDFAEFVKNALAYSAFFGGLSLVFGYFCVGIAFGVFKTIQVQGKINIQDMPPGISEY